MKKSTSLQVCERQQVIYLVMVSSAKTGNLAFVDGAYTTRIAAEQRMARKDQLSRELYKYWITTTNFNPVETN